MALKNNAVVSKGDTLIKIAKESLLTEKQTQGTLSGATQILLEDMANLLVNRVSHIKTPTAKEEFYQYQARKNELQSKVAQTQINFKP